MSTPRRMTTARELPLREWVKLHQDGNEADRDVLLTTLGLINMVASSGAPAGAEGRLDTLLGNNEFNRIVEVIDGALKRLASDGTGRDHLRQIMLKQVELGVQLLVLKLKSGEAVFNGHAAAPCETGTKEASK